MQIQQKRPEFRNIGIGDLRGYRLPLAGLMSILHRISGLGMFLLLPLVLWMFDASLRSPQSYAQLGACLASWPLRIIELGLFWALTHHLCAGIRHLLMEVFHAFSKEQGRRYAALAFTVSVLATVAFAAHLFMGA